MIHEVRGDITNAEDGIILHCVNCQGVMGAGVAKSIRNKWPIVYGVYMDSCQNSISNELLGMSQLVSVNGGLFVCNLFAQEFYGADRIRYVSYDAMDESLRLFANQATHHLFRGLPVHFPMMGAGLAGGHWPVIREIIEHRLPDNKFKKHLWIL